MGGIVIPSPYIFRRKTPKENLGRDFRAECPKENLSWPGESKKNVETSEKFQKKVVQTTWEAKAHTYIFDIEIYY